MPQAEDSGVIAIRQLAARHLEYRAPQTPPAAPRATAPRAPAPPVWTGYAPPPAYVPVARPTFGALGLAAQRPRPRWGRRIVVGVVLLAGGAIAARPYWPAEVAEAFAPVEEALGGLLHGASASVRGLQGEPLSPSVRETRSAARGPQIVPMPAPQAARPEPAELAPEPRERTVRLPSGPAGRPAQKLAAAAPAAAPRAPAAPAVAAAAPEADPFENRAPAAPKAAAAEPPAPKPAAEPKPAPEPAERPAAEPAASGDGLDGLMAVAVKPKARSRGGSELDRQLAGFQDEAPAPAQKKEEPSARPALSRSDIQAVMRGVQDKASACRDRPQDTGAADLTVTVTPEGSVSQVALAGKYAGTPVGACIEKAVKAASFPPSAGLRFPYRLLVR